MTDRPVDAWPGADAASGPLAGLRVLDLSSRLPGPLASLMLAQTGARVLRIERPPHGEETRAMAPQIDGVSAHYRWMNRGKDTLLLDLKADADRQQFETLLQATDILIEQFRPGVMDRLGYGPDTLMARHPALIYCSISGYGRHDPRSLRPAHDLNYQADAGLVSAAAPGERGVPVLPTVLLGDIAGGSYPAMLNIVLAVLQRTRTGRGSFIDIAMSQNVELFAFWWTIEGTLTGRWPVPGRGRHSGGTPRYNLYATRDGRTLAVGALEDRFWAEFLDGVGLVLPDGLERDDPQAAIGRVAAHLASQDADHWLARLAGRDACCNLVADPRKAAGSAAARLPEIPLPIAPQFTNGR